MVSEEHILTRRELYDLVWSKPMSKLAVEFGLSDRGLAKLCERHRVPVPPRGYWAKLNAGKKVKQAIFRDVRDVALDRVVISANQSNLPEESQTILRRAKELRVEQARRNRQSGRMADIVTFDPIEVPHLKLQPTVKALRSARPDDWGAVYALKEGQCGVTVGKANVERALSILDKLFRVADEKGWTIEAHGRHTRLSQGPDSARIKLSERTSRIAHEPTDAELAAYHKKKRDKERRYAANGWGTPSVDLGGRDWDQTWPDFDTVYSGQLVFQIDEYGGGLRKSWADGKTQTVEKLFEQIIVGIEAYLAFEKSRREEREEWNRQAEVMQNRRALARQRQEREDKRLTFLRDVMAMQHEAAELRTWLGQIADPGETRPDDFGRMISWARQRLHDLDIAITQEALSARLSAAQLFPEVDELHDPQGAPPDRYW